MLYCRNVNIATIRRTMRKTWDMLSIVIIGIAVFSQLEFVVMENNSWYHQVRVDKFLAWGSKPPYAQLPKTDSPDNNVHGMIRDVILQGIRRCTLIFRDIHGILIVNFNVTTQQVASEYEMIELLRDNKVHMAFPIFELPTNRRYSDFRFLRLADYPGSEFITTEDKFNALDVVLQAVLKAWPLLAVTVILTVIAGVIMWALDTYWNSKEFSRSFIRGSWDGFWWSFISMTTVGYGDKSPKSIVARIFSIIWIMLGLIVMAIFTADITSALTAHTIGPTSLFGLKIGVLSNGTEYEHAQEDDAYPTVFNKIEDLVQALNTKQVDGMLMDHYTAAYYQSQDKLKSLITVKKFGFLRAVGILFPKDPLSIKECFNSRIRRLFQRTLAKRYKLKRQHPTQNASLFDNSLPFVKQFLYILLGVLGGLILIGTLWEIFNRRRAKAKDNVVLVRKRKLNEGRLTEQDIIRDDLKVTRKLLQDHFDKLEAYVLRRLQDNNDIISEERPEDQNQKEIP